MRHEKLETRKKKHGKLEAWTKSRPITRPTDRQPARPPGDLQPDWSGSRPTDRSAILSTSKSSQKTYCFLFYFFKTFAVM